MNLCNIVQVESPSFMVKMAKKEILEITVDVKISPVNGKKNHQLYHLHSHLEKKAMFFYIKRNELNLLRCGFPS